jgi:hypothetical protein
MDTGGHMQCGNQQHKKPETNRKTATRKSPSQICVSPYKKNSKANSERGKAQQKHPHKSVATRHSGEYHRVNKIVHETN